MTDYDTNGKAIVQKYVAERALVVEEYKDQQGELVTGVVKKATVMHRT
ncbi:hypothetical protein [Pseudoalteromonas lipolytica]